jgi:hypothetical protein
MRFEDRSLSAGGGAAIGKEREAGRTRSRHAREPAMGHSLPPSIPVTAKTSPSQPRIIIEAAERRVVAGIPAQHAASEICDLFKALAVQDDGGLCRASAGTADRDDGLFLRQFIRSFGEFRQGNADRRCDMTQWPDDFIGLAHIDDLNACCMLFEPLRRDFPYAGESQAQGRPIRLGRRNAALGLAAAQIGGHGNIDLLGVRQSEIGEIADKIGLAERAAYPWIIALLLVHRRCRRAAIVMRRQEQTIVRQREDLLLDRMIELLRITMLKIGSPTAAYQQRVTGESARKIVENIGETAIGMARRRADFERARAELDHVAMLEISIRAFGTARARKRDLAAKPLLQEPGAGDMIGMDMRVQSPKQFEPELADEGSVAPHLLEHRIDEHAGA